MNILRLSLILSLLTGCDKPAEPTKPATAPTGTDTSTATDETPVDPASFDLCGGLSETLASLEGFAPAEEALCGSGDGLKTLRAEYLYTGGEPKLFKPKGSAGDGSAISVRLLTATLVEANASDYFALVRLQVSRPKAFKNNYFHDDGIELSDVSYEGDHSSFTYEYTDGEGRVAYKATSRFYTVKAGQAFVSATGMDESIETMKSLKGLVIVNQKDATHSEVITISDQTYEVAPGQDPKLYDQSATKKAGAEQQRMFKNAAKAGEAKGLLAAD